MSYSVKLAALGQMTDAEQATVLTEMVSSARGKRNGQALILNSQVREFEQRYEMASTEMMTRLKAGTMEETQEIARWLFLLNARDNRLSGNRQR